MTQWATFAGLVGVVLVSLLALSQLTERSLTPAGGAGSGDETPAHTSPGRTGRHGAGTDTGADSVPDADSTSKVGQEDGSSPGRAGAIDLDADPETPSSADPETRSHVESPVGDRDDDGVTIDVPGIESRTSDSRRPPVAGPRGREGTAAYVDGQPVSTAALLGNVAVTQGLFAAVVVGAAIYTGIPADALGIELTASALRTGLLGGAALGLALYAANEGGAAIARRAGIDHDETLREMLAPDSIRGWGAMLLVVLPLIAAFEELLFRAAIVGALSIGFDLSPWLLAVVSSVAFAVGHGVQGTTGVAVTGLLGLVLAAAFVLTWNLWLVIVAHYLINALEFVVHEGLGIDWAGPAAGDAEP